ncbi:uncharacterized protein LOC109720960 [Ananas comosus]|uniref:Uncharacterized protein LOC109720960 n=1 Tax=Ananas comosus TaxID=4615 RepID=A0A6P5G5Q7_ANACO|nr:uncharacterized protein LOC109720960 [Ananas comosus]
MGLSFVPLIDAYIRRCYVSAGLRPSSVAIDDETTIHCWIPSANPNPNPKPALVLIHGFGPRATWQWRWQVGALAPHFHLVVPDLLFFGGSSTRSPLRSEAFQAAAVARLLEALGLLGGAGRVAVAGTSYGGFVAYHLARALGAERVERVVIASSDVLKAEADDRELARRGGVGGVAELMLPRDAASLRALVGLAFYRAPRFVPEFVLRDVIRNLLSDRLKEKMELIKGLTLGKDEFQLTPLSQEVLIIWGEHDQIFPVEKAFELKRCLGEKARLEILDRTGHVPQMERPNKFNKVLLNFLLGSPRPSL